MQEQLGHKYRELVYFKQVAVSELDEINSDLQQIGKLGGKVVERTVESGKYTGTATYYVRALYVFQVPINDDADQAADS